MHRVLVLAAALALALPAAGQAPPSVDPSDWTILREDPLGFTLRHPPSWRVGRSTGTLESVILAPPAPEGAPRVTVQLFVQRGINPGRLSIEAWYEDQLRRLKVTVTAPPPIVRTAVGGLATIRREMSRPGSQQYDFYTATTGADVFQVSVTQPQAAQLDRTCEAAISTIAFLR